MWLIYNVVSVEQNSPGIFVCSGKVKLAHKDSITECLAPTLIKRRHNGGTGEYLYGNGNSDWYLSDGMYCMSQCLDSIGCRGLVFRIDTCYLYRNIQPKNRTGYTLYQLLCSGK